ncbi:hypothetical protein ACFUJX_20330 [Streptomyces rubiginosohelvolus]|uniref:hypothetical protein n=1 Tax=Streptomyces rubiginosohelvolus TaxID=67362 RepID=UPI003635F77A
MTEPVEARCDHCKQTRTLFLFEPDHGHLGAGQFTCRWCTRETQELLCPRCWSAEKEREENDPGIQQDAKTMKQICDTNALNVARREAAAARDRAECDGIAEATRNTRT